MKLSRFCLVAIKLILIACAFVGAKHFCHSVTGGFTISKITSSYNDISFDQIADQTQVAQLLNQPYYFYGKGGQCFAFISEDGKTIIKFFKHHHMRFWEWLSEVRFPFGLDPIRVRLLYKHRHQTLPYFLHSCKFSYEQFKKETGLIYMQFGKTDFLQQKLVIYDNINIPHTIDLGSMAFAIQEKAEPLLPKFKKLIKQKELELCKRYIDSIVDLIAERCHQGIADRDFNIHTNFGLVDTRVIEIDIGSFHDDSSLKETLSLQAELVQLTDEFKKWLEKYNQELSDYLSEQIRRVACGQASDNKQRDSFSYSF